MPWDPVGAWPAARWWIWAALCALVCVAAGSAFVRNLRPAPGVVVDFFRNWAAARDALAGLPVYDDQQAVQERYLGRRPDVRDVHYVEIFTHPPATVLLALPFAGLDYPDATLAWNLVSLAALAVSAWLVGRALEISRSFWAVFPLLTLLLLCTPLWDQLGQGQLNLILLALVTGTWVAERSGRPVWAGFFLGAATALKLFPGFLALYFVLRGQWSVLIAAACTLAALVGVTLILPGPDAYRAYLEQVMPHLGRCQGFGYNASLLGLWSKLFDPGSEPIQPLWYNPALARVGGYLSCATVVAVLAWVVRRARSRAEADQAFGLAVTAMLLVTPIVWDHYFVILLVPLALLWVHLPACTGMRAAFLLIVLNLWIHPMIWWQTLVSPRFETSVVSPVHVLTLLSIPCYALLGLFALGVVVATRARADGKVERKPDQTSPPGGA